MEFYRITAIKKLLKDNIWLIVYFLLITNALMLAGGVFVLFKQIQDIRTRMTTYEGVLVKLAEGNLPMYQQDGKTYPILPWIINSIIKLRDGVESDNTRFKL